MCGICGVIGAYANERSADLVRQMLGAIVHRGPDEEGILLAPPVVAGTRRLSILDLPGGGQPIWNESGTIAVVFNGEIYNFRELRTDLEARGHSFHTRCDTETIVHAYEEWGAACPERLQGMFAFAVVEIPAGESSRATRVFLARDPLGIKPLYYAVAEGALFFASEVRALLKTGCIGVRLSEKAAASYLLFGSVGEPMTLLEGVYSLPPGHRMTVAADAPVPQPEAYWNFAQSLSSRPAQSTKRNEQPAQCVRRLLEDAVRSHLIADVPVGIFLSSGLDSAIIAVLARRVQEGFHTFTVSFPDLEFDEAEQARRSARQLGADHHELRLSDSDMLARIEEAIASMDQPSMDGINTYFVSWAARQAGLKVALSGLGSDELFGGYSTFRSTSTIERLQLLARFVPRSLRGILAFALQKIKTNSDAGRKVAAAWLDPDGLLHPYFLTRALFTPQTVSSWLGRDVSDWCSSPWWQWLAQAAREAESLDGFTAVSWLELRSYLANTLLRDTDAMSMCHSLEVRLPFLDRPVVEYVVTLPESAKRPQPVPKALLLQAMGDLLPPALHRQPKRTFTLPWQTWLRGRLGRRVEAGLADWSPALETVLGGATALTVWKQFLRGDTSWSRPWSLYVLNEWAKRHTSAKEAKGRSMRAHHSSRMN